MRRALEFRAVLFALLAGGCGTAHVRPAPGGTLVAQLEQPPTSSGESRGAGAPKSQERAPIEDTSKKHASLETAAYTDDQHVSVFTPSITGNVENVVDGASLSGTYLVDVVSAASVDILSTASPQWHEVRHAGMISGAYKPRDLGVGFSGSASSEPDYFSVGASGHLTYDLDEKNTSLFAGYGFGRDTIGRRNTPFTVFARTLLKGNFLAGVQQVLGPSTTASFAFSLAIENGDQSKPYRYIPLFTPGEAAQVPNGASIEYVDAHRTLEKPLEQLPLSRRRYALTSELAHRFDGSTIRASERVYTDTWNLHASTTDARWYFDAGRRLMIWPHVRFHVQTPVVFWKRAYVSGNETGWDLPVYRTGDRELGPMWTITGGAGTKLFLGSAAHPRFFAMTFEADVMYTAYTDDLYVTNRTGILGSITFELGEP